MTVYIVDILELNRSNILQCHENSTIFMELIIITPVLFLMRKTPVKPDITLKRDISVHTKIPETSRFHCHKLDHDVDIFFKNL